MEVLKLDAASRGEAHGRGACANALAPLRAEVAAGAVAHAAPCGATGPGSNLACTLK